MLKPQEFIEAYGQIGAAKSKRSAKELFLLGILAGIILGLAASAAATASHALSNSSLARLVSSLVFPIGLVVIIFTGAELFTGNCLISISVLEKKASPGGMARNLIIVYLGNFIGCAAVAAACVYSGQMDFNSGALAVYAVKTAAAKCSLNFGKAIVLGIMCNVLVCLGVVCAISAKSAAGKAIGAYLPVCVFIICGFEHSIANMYFVPAGLFASLVPAYEQAAVSAGIALEKLSWINFAVRNLLPVTVGNILGGAGLGALLQYCGKRK